MMQVPAAKTAPISGRVTQDDGTTKTLIMSIGREKLDGDRDLARMIYQVLVLNGAQYCRPHLLIRCHLCARDGWSLKDEADEERRNLGLRPSGDKALDQRARKWSNRTKEAILENVLQRDLLIQRYGKNHAQTHPEHWQQLRQDMRTKERAINDEFLQDTPEVSQCCYWACQQPDNHKLLRCSGCGIAKYCCREHQTEDWKWEHKGECQVPEFILAEYADDRKRNLAGDYKTRKDLQPNTQRKSRGSKIVIVFVLAVVVFLVKFGFQLLTNFILTSGIALLCL
jgi:hypothetical protein